MCVYEVSMFNKTIDHVVSVCMLCVSVHVCVCVCMCVFNAPVTYVCINAYTPKACSWQLVDA